MKSLGRTLLDFKKYPLTAQWVGKQINKQRRLSGTYAFYAIVKRQDWFCHYGGGKLKRSKKDENGYKVQIDHLIPVAKGGGNGLDNLVASCVKHNQLKKDMDYNAFLSLAVERNWDECGN